jgi:chemotaxis protein MotB
VHGLLKNPDIDPGRVMIEGHADSRPLVPNDSSVNRAINRRVELILERGNDKDNGEMLIIEDPKS